MKTFKLLRKAIRQATAHLPARAVESDGRGTLVNVLQTQRGQYRSLKKVLAE